MKQLPTFQISDDTRLGRMLAAGRLTATMRSKATGTHITLTMNAKAKIENKWKSVPFSEATHVFIQQGPGGWGSPKVGTYYPKTGKLYTETGFDTAPWLYAITHTFLAAQTGVQDTEQYDIQEANRCGKCGLELRDPVSIERGIGPTCLGSETGSQHYHKGLERVADGDQVFVMEQNTTVEDRKQEVLDQKGRALPKTFDELAAAVR